MTDDADADASSRWHGTREQHRVDGKAMGGGLTGRRRSVGGEVLFVVV